MMSSCGFESPGVSSLKIRVCSTSSFPTINLKMENS